MRITLVRHGESEGNTKVHDYTQAGDHQVNLTALGRDQAFAAGEKLRDVLQRSIVRTERKGTDGVVSAQTRTLVYRSPYARTRQTLEWMYQGAGALSLQDLPAPRIHEDPRLRETDHGYSDVEEQEALRRLHGFFYYRYAGGESPADNFDRISSFLESMMRQVARKTPDDVVIVTHGLAIRCFVMRFMHLSVEQFESLANPGNCDIITIDLKEHLSEPMFTSGRWGVEGLRKRESAVLTQPEFAPL